MIFPAVCRNLYFLIMGIIYFYFHPASSEEGISFISFKGVGCILLCYNNR
jgi:hypothetical protein